MSRFFFREGKWTKLISRYIEPILARWRERWRIMATKSRTYPGMKVDEGMRNSGFRLEGRQHPFAELCRLIPEHHVPCESITSKQASHEANIRLEQRYFGVLKQSKRSKTFKLIMHWSFITGRKNFIIHTLHTCAHVSITFSYNRLLLQPVCPLTKIFCDALFLNL